MKDRIKLTKKSFATLTNRHIGAGQVFIHTGTNEVTSLDFWLGRNGYFYCNGENGKPKILIQALITDAQELHKRELQQDKEEFLKERKNERR